MKLLSNNVFLLFSETCALVLFCCKKGKTCLGVSGVAIGGSPTQSASRLEGGRAPFASMSERQRLYSDEHRKFSDRPQSVGKIHSTSRSSVRSTIRPTSAAFVRAVPPQNSRVRKPLDGRREADTIATAAFCREI